MNSTGESGFIAFVPRDAIIDEPSANIDPAEGPQASMATRSTLRFLKMVE